MDLRTDWLMAGLSVFVSIKQQGDTIMQKRIDIKTMQAIHDMFVCGLALTDETYTDEQVEEICNTFDEMYNEFMYKCK